MAMFGSLKGELSKYRKRKTISIDRPVAGAHFPVGSSQPPQFSIDLPHHTKEYDPTHAAYDFSGPEYVPPKSWFEGMNTGPIDQIRLDPVKFDRPQPQELCYENNLMTQEFMDVILAELAERDSSSAQETVENTVSEAPAVDDILEIADPSIPEPQQMELEDMTQEALAEMPMQENIQTLEHIVEQEINQLGATMQQPFEDPYQQQMLLYEQQMQQMLNPFMMQGGFGPMGPGPM